MCAVGVMGEKGKERNEKTRPKTERSGKTKEYRGWIESGRTNWEI